MLLYFLFLLCVCTRKKKNDLCYLKSGFRLTCRQPEASSTLHFHPFVMRVYKTDKKINKHRHFPQVKQRALTLFIFTLFTFFVCGGRGFKLFSSLLKQHARITGYADSLLILGFSLPGFPSLIGFPVPRWVTSAVLLSPRVAALFIPDLSLHSSNLVLK